MTPLRRSEYERARFPGLSLYGTLFSTLSTGRGRKSFKALNRRNLMSADVAIFNFNWFCFFLCFCQFICLFVCLSLFWWGVIKATIDLNETFKG